MFWGSKEIRADLLSDYRQYVNLENAARDIYQYYRNFRMNTFRQIGRDLEYFHDVMTVLSQKNGSYWVLAILEDMTVFNPVLLTKLLIHENENKYVGLISLALNHLEDPWQEKAFFRTFMPKDFRQPMQLYFESYQDRVESIERHKNNIFKKLEEAKKSGQYPSYFMSIDHYEPPHYLDEKHKIINLRKDIWIKAQ